MFRPLIAMLMTGCLVVVTAAPPSIGTIKSPGDFRLDGSTIRGNGTLFSGNVVETAAARSVLDLGAAQITLSPDSRAKVYRDRTVLEKGTSVVRDAEQHVVEAATLRISPESKRSVLQIELRGPRQVAVAARAGSAEVRNGAGVLVAKLSPGMALAFDPQAAATGAVELTGILEARNGKFFLTDKTNNVTVELVGTGLDKYAGKTVQIKGSTIPGAVVAAGASQLVQVSEIKEVGGKKVAAAAAGGAAAGGAAAGAGIGTAATVAIVGGVAVAGTAAGLAAAGTFSRAEPASRQ